MIFSKDEEVLLPFVILETIRCEGESKTTTLAHAELTNDASSDEEHGQRRRSGDLCDLLRRKKQGKRRRERGRR